MSKKRKITENVDVLSKIIKNMKVLYVSIDEGQYFLLSCVRMSSNILQKIYYDNKYLIVYSVSVNSNSILINGVFDLEEKKIISIDDIYDYKKYIDIQQG